MQVYIKLDKDIAEWYKTLPLRGKSIPLNEAIRRGLSANNTERDAILQELTTLKQMIANIKVVAADEEPPEEEFSLAGFASMAKVDDFD